MPVNRGNIGIKSLTRTIVSTRILSTTAVAAVGSSSGMPLLPQDRQVNRIETNMAEAGSTYMKSEHGMSTTKLKLLRRSPERRS